METIGGDAVILEVFILAVAFDLLLGEPPATIHPVVWIGRLISFLRARARPTRLCGLAVALLVIAVTVICGHILVVAAGVVPFLGTFVAAYLLKSTFAIKCLLQTSRDIGRMIEEDMQKAKAMLPALVGRDTSGLSEAQASSAVIESLTENYVDSILSPILYYLLFSPFGLGLEAALAFKAVSTMDSMLGYKTDELKELGFAAARLDDLANWIPARLSVIIMALARPLKAANVIGAALRYHDRTPSPNSGWPISAAAGALEIRLEKPGYYIILDQAREPLPADIRRSLSYMVSVTALTLAASIIALAVLNQHNVYPV
jgi:adenosylcobinamide-phosphate synthase